MKLPRRNFLHLAAGAAALSGVSRIAWAQTYPTRPVRIIVETHSRTVNDFYLDAATSEDFGLLVTAE
jgi:hypothetical protein